MQNKKLYRSNKDVMIAGVAGGLGDYLNLDPTIIRLIFVFLFLTGSAGFWIYLIMWLVVPKEPSLIETSVEPIENDPQI